MYHNFPPKWQPFDGHIKLFFVHWMPKGLIRRSYIALCYSLGIGIHRDVPPAKQDEYFTEQAPYWSYSKINNLFMQNFEKVEYINEKPLLWLDQNNIKFKLMKILQRTKLSKLAIWAMLRFYGILALVSKPIKC